MTPTPEASAPVRERLAEVVRSCCCGQNDLCRPDDKALDQLEALIAQERKAAVEEAFRRSWRFLPPSYDHGEMFIYDRTVEKIKARQQKAFNEMFPPNHQP